MKNLIPVLLVAALASQTDAQNVIHYWDFSAATDVVGSVPTSAVGTVDMSIDATYGEAYPGSGNSLNTILGGLGSGGGFLSGDVHDGTSATALATSASDDFAFSYWAYDDTSDGDGRGPRIMDCLNTTTEGIQLGTNLSNNYNLRLDDDSGGSVITNNIPPLDTVKQPGDKWVHVAVNVSRTAGQLEVFFDGVSQGSISISLTGIAPTTDLDIGVINGGTNPGGAQKSGLDDLAFYDGLLSATDIAGLAAGTLTPLSFAPCPSVPSAEVVRVGTPPNPAALLPGVTSGPIVGATWDPVIDHTTFLPGATLDLMLLTALPLADLDLGPFTGTLLCDIFIAPPLVFGSGAGVPFSLSIPSDCKFVGRSIYVQGVSTDGVGTLLTNALDVVIGSF